MKNPFHTFALVCVIFIVHVACNSSDKATFTVHLPKQPNVEIIISPSEVLEATPILSTRTDSLGNRVFDIEVGKPKFVYLKIGNSYGELYVSPGDELMIEKSPQGSAVPFYHSGNGAEVNNYLAWVNTHTDRIRMAGNVPLPDMSDEQFLKRYDSLKTTINNFHAQYTDSVVLSEKDEALLVRKNQIKMLTVSQEYKFYRANAALIEKREHRDNGTLFLEAEISPEIENLTNEVPFVPDLLTDGYSDYQMLLNFFWHNVIYLPASEQVQLANRKENLLPLMTDSLIDKADYPAEVQHFIKSFNINFWLSRYGITPETDSVFARLQRTNAHSKYTQVVQKQYNEWLGVQPGKPAPDLTGSTPDGSQLSIRDLRGKLIYIDVWATWCAPCVAEIPASKKLQEKFAKEPGVVFLNVSVDYEKEHWDNFMAKDTTWKGLHLIIAADEIQSFYKRYKMSYVPRYMIIDKSGNIVTLSAPRPSDEQASTQLQALLAQTL
ncbi:MAG TPA: TlpA disulfide reductase family protein [Chryseosolibacter sp.]